MKVPEKNRLEWSVFAISLAVIVMVLATLIRFEIVRPDTPPELHVRTTTIRPAGDMFAVGVEVENRGGETASNAGIEVELTANGRNPERGELQLPFVPRGAVRTGEVMFTTDPAAGRLRARILGYETAGR